MPSDNPTDEGETEQPPIEQTIAELRSLADEAEEDVDQRKSDTDLSDVDPSHLALADSPGMLPAYQHALNVAISKRDENPADHPDTEDVPEALFEALAALADLRERLVGGAQRSGVSPEQVIESVWSAYDLEGASDTLSETGYERGHAIDPEDFAVEGRKVQPGGNDGE